MTSCNQYDEHRTENLIKLHFKGYRYRIFHSTLGFGWFSILGSCPVTTEGICGGQIEFDRSQDMFGGRGSDFSKIDMNKAYWIRPHPCPYQEFTVVTFQKNFCKPHENVLKP